MVSSVLGTAVGWVEGYLSQLLGEMRLHLALFPRGGGVSNDYSRNKGTPLPSPLTLIFSSDFADMTRLECGSLSASLRILIIRNECFPRYSH